MSSERTGGTDSGKSSSERTQSDERAQAEESQKSYRTILAQEIEEGLVELNRPTSGQFLSGLSAGLDIGFGPFLMAVVLSLPRGGLAPPVYQLLIASAYAIGFVFVILGRSDLFTEQTTLATLPVLHGRASYTELAKVWVAVYTANVVGAAAFAAFAVVVGPAIAVVDLAAFGTLAHELVRYSWWATLLSGVLAGWLMGLLSWLVRATRDTISIIFVVWIVTGAIGYAHLPHSIAGTVEVLVGLFAGQGISLAEFAEFLVWSTAGNVVGGTVFVGILKHSHAMRGGSEPGRVSIGQRANGRTNAGPAQQDDGEE